jgi:DDE_Tnp_1-associated
MKKSLIDYLKEIPDFRQRQGCRHSLWLVLLITIMGIISGYWGYQGLGRFIERHRRDLIKLLAIPQARVPSYSTIRRVIMGLDYKELAKVFNQWASQYSNLPSHEWVSIDGKGLKNTVTEYDSAEQNFINIVSLFTHQRGLVLGVRVMENKKTSEITTVRELLEILDLTGFVFTLDALHCQKKQSRTL